MWQIDNRTPFAAGQGWVRDLNGAETWLVVVRSTFDVAPDGSLSVAGEQPEPSRAPVYRGEPGESSLELDNDFVLEKVTTDVLVNGQAHAPGGRPRRVVDVAIRVGPVTKEVRVYGNRSWTMMGTLLSDPEPFLTMPLVYERAFGGPDGGSAAATRAWFAPNPVGTGYATSWSSAGAIVPPNIEFADQAIGSWSATPAPAGLGVIASNWLERARFAGTYDRAWSLSRQPLLPLDFDPRYFQMAPPDQQAPAFMTGGEPVSLINLTASGNLAFLLPRVALRLRTFFMDGTTREHQPPKLHTVLLEPDFPRVSLIWHSAIECHERTYTLDHTRVEAPGFAAADRKMGSVLDEA